MSKWKMLVLMPQNVWFGYDEVSLEIIAEWVFFYGILDIICHGRGFILVICFSGFWDVEMSGSIYGSILYLPAIQNLFS